MRWPLRIAIICVTLGILVSGTLLVFKPYRPIPQDVKKQLTSTLLMPHGSGYQGAYDSAVYDNTNKLLTFTFNAGGTNVVVSEQPEPVQFNDITGYYTAFIKDLNEYTNFGSINGTVYLFHPKNSPKKTAAVMVDAGTLMFVNPRQQPY